MLNEFTPLSNERSKQFRTEKPNFKSLESLPKAILPKLWNELPSELRKMGCHRRFKNKLRKDKTIEYKMFVCRKRHCYPCKK